MNAPRHTLLIVPLALGLALAAPAPAAAQGFVGQVLDEENGQPLAGARVTLLDPEGVEHGEAFTGNGGNFVLRAPTPGEWVLVIDRLGYHSITSDPMPLAEGERVALEILLLVDPIAMEEAVKVTGRREHASPDIQRFYDRMERGRLTGLGRFLSREEIERSNPSLPTDLMRTIPGVRVVGTGARSGRTLRMAGNCSPAVFVDGMQINRAFTASLDDYVSTLSIEGIEVYRGSQQPVGRFVDRNGCGVVLVWTRRGSTDGPAFTWTRFIIGATLLLGVLFMN